ncbi:MAG TPA: GyrI-like domain-containing protein, partial [Gemmatimonadaceae bacterium]
MSKHDYEERIGRVIEYVFDHLGDELDLNRLAEIACLSPYHWHGVYTAMRGETLAATVKRLRLSGSHTQFDHTYDARTQSMYDVTIKTIAPMSGVSIAHTGPYMEISRAFEQLFGWLGPRMLIGPDTRSFGIFYDDPSSVPAAALRSRAAAVMSKKVPVEAPIEAVEIAGG